MASLTKPAHAATDAAARTSVVISAPSCWRAGLSSRALRGLARRFPWKRNHVSFLGLFQIKNYGLFYCS